MWLTDLLSSPYTGVPLSLAAFLFYWGLKHYLDRRVLPPFLVWKRGRVERSLESQADYLRRKLAGRPYDNSGRQFVSTDPH